MYRVVTAAALCAASAFAADVCSHTTCSLRCKGDRTVEECNGEPDSVCRDVSDCHTVVKDYHSSESGGDHHECKSDLSTGSCQCLCSNDFVHSKLIHDVSRVVKERGMTTLGHHRIISDTLRTGNGAPVSVEYPSCEAWMNAEGASAADGAKTIILNNKTFKTLCDQTTEGGGWTLAATITSSGTAWTYGDSGGDSGQASSAWENGIAFGDYTSGDYKSSAWTHMPKNQIMITLNGKHLLTTDTCADGDTMQQTFNGLFWDATGSMASPSSYHRCKISTRGPVNHDDISLVRGGIPGFLYLKWGEKDGAQDSNKDRAYISTSMRSSVDAPEGLGAFSRIAGQSRSVNVGITNDAAIAAPGGKSYRIWIRQSV